LVALALIEGGKYTSVYGYTWESNISLTIYHHVLALLLSSSCD